MSGTPEQPIDPDLEQAIAQLVARHGREAVKEAVGRQAATRRGRKEEPDLQRLAAELMQDARDLLEGRNLRSNYVVAKEFADRHQGQSVEATRDRLKRKLSEYRPLLAFAVAAHIGADGYPYTDYLRVLEQMAALSEPAKQRFSDASGDLAAYRDRIGEPPDNMSIWAITKAVRQSLEKSSRPSARMSIFGSRSLLDSGRD